jgi:hypothetical protein
VFIPPRWMGTSGTNARSGRGSPGRREEVLYGAGPAVEKG